jgi:hypothetical protein
MPHPVPNRLLFDCQFFRKGKDAAECSFSDRFVREWTIWDAVIL